MRGVIVVVVVVLVLALLGWLRFSSPSGDPAVRIDTAEIQEDTGEIAEQGRAAINRMHAEIQDDEEVRPDPPRDASVPSAEANEQ